MKTKSQQRGITFIGLLVVGVLIALAVIVVAQVVPTYTEYLAVQRAAKKSAGESSVAAVRAAFNRQATIEQITSINGYDIEVTKVDGNVVVSFEYQREIHLTGPAYLVMKYSGASND